MVASRRANSLQDALAVLNCHRLPARLNTSEVAILLGFQEHDIAPLVAARLLSPLGKPAPNAPKYFAAVEIERCAQDADWLSQATRALAKHWLGKNSRKVASCEQGEASAAS
jgi:hypothetical protein